MKSNTIKQKPYPLGSRLLVGLGSTGATPLRFLIIAQRWLLQHFERTASSGAQAGDFAMVVLAHGFGMIMADISECLPTYLHDEVDRDRELFWVMNIQR